MTRVHHAPLEQERRFPTERRAEAEAWRARLAIPLLPKLSDLQQFGREAQDACVRALATNDVAEVLLTMSSLMPYGDHGVVKDNDIKARHQLLQTCGHVAPSADAAVGRLVVHILDVVCCDEGAHRGGQEERPGGEVRWRGELSA